MSTAVIIVAVVAVVAIVVLVMFGRRRASDAAGEQPAEVEKEPAVVAKPEEIPAEAVPSEAKSEEAAQAAAEVEEAAAAAEEAPPKPAPEPVETEEEVAERVQGSLAEARRMLEELQKQAGDEGDATGTLDIMSEGLAEVQALADGGKWGQAGDKAEALHAQLKLMLQAARRESPSD